MNKIINLLDVDIGPHRNDFACVDCKHSHWYTGCYGPTIAQNEKNKIFFEKTRIRSNYTPQEFLVKETGLIKKELTTSYEQKDEEFKKTTTLDQFISQFKQNDLLKMASHYIQRCKESVLSGPTLEPENVVLVCYCKVLYKETFNTTLTDRKYFHMTACEAKPGMLKEEIEGK